MFWLMKSEPAECSIDDLAARQASIAEIEAKLEKGAAD